MHATAPRTAIGVLAATAAIALTLSTNELAIADHAEWLANLLGGEATSSTYAFADVIHGLGGTNHSQILLIG